MLAWLISWRDLLVKIAGFAVKLWALWKQTRNMDEKKSGLNQTIMINAETVNVNVFNVNIYTSSRQ